MKASSFDLGLVCSGRSQYGATHIVRDEFECIESLPSGRPTLAQIQTLESRSHGFPLEIMRLDVDDEEHARDPSDEAIGTLAPELFAILSREDEVYIQPSGRPTARPSSNTVPAAPINTSKPLDPG